jgi:hypothetical protein
MNAPHIRLSTHPGEDGAAYLELAAHPALMSLRERPELPQDGPGSIARSIDIHGMIKGYNGPRLCLDLDSDGRPIGIEIVYSFRDFDPDDS